MIFFNIILFDGFETLDAFGPAELIGCAPGLYRLGYYSINGGVVESSQAIRVETSPFTQMDTSCVLLIPGGSGTRILVDDNAFISAIRNLAQKASFVLSVCTGAAILAKAGLLDGKQATTNKLAFDWVKSHGPNTNWIERARWVVDGKYYTSSGVSAGMDMVLGFVEDRNGGGVVREICRDAEYVWNSDKDNDPFAKS